MKLHTKLRLILCWVLPRPFAKLKNKHSACLISDILLGFCGGNKSALKRGPDETGICSKKLVGHRAPGGGLGTVVAAPDDHVYGCAAAGPEYLTSRKCRVVP